MARAMSVTQVISKKRKLMQFENEFKASFGLPELMGTWIIWGISGSGKTTFVMMLCKYLTKFGRVAYNSMEEGDSESIKLALIRVGMSEVRKRFIFLPNEPMDELKERLRKHKAPEIIVIDSLQYSGMSYAEYKELRSEFPNTLFLMISHAKGKEPNGSVADRVRYDAFVKVRVEGYKAFVTSRYGGGEPFVVWKEKADEYHGV